MTAAKLDSNMIGIDGNLVFVDRDAFKAAKVNADSTLDVLAKALRAAPGVRARGPLFQAPRRHVCGTPSRGDGAHQFPANVPIELIVTLTPFSTFGGNVASHGSAYDYDSHVPLIFYGAGVKPGRVTEFVRTVDLAPTLAAIAGVKPTERLDGVVLKKGLAVARSDPTESACPHASDQRCAGSTGHASACWTCASATSGSRSRERGWRRASTSCIASWRSARSRCVRTAGCPTSGSRRRTCRASPSRSISRIRG